MALKNKSLVTVFFLSALFLLINGCNNDDSPAAIERTFKTVTGFIISETGSKLLATDDGMFVLNETTGKFDFYINKNDVKPFNDLTFSKTPSKILWLASNEGILNISEDVLINSGNSGLKSNQVHRLEFDFSNRGIFANPDGLSINDNGKWFFSSGKTIFTKIMRLPM